MTRKIILVRHGNTFEAGDTPVWVGARTDLPLTAFGLTQAEAVGAALAHHAIRPNALITGPLRRTQDTAAAIARLTGYSGTIATDPRLREIDYGAWEARSNADIDAMGHAAERAAWDRDAIFPPSPGWSPDAATLAANAEAVLNACTAPTTVIVTSNGILRFFAALATNAAAFPNRKVATGHLCQMTAAPDGWHIAFWNLPPDRFPHL